MKLKDACSLEEVITNRDSILKSRDITLPTQVRLVKAFVQGLNQEQCCSPDIGVNHYPIIHINLSKNIEQNRNMIIFSFCKVNCILSPCLFNLYAEYIMRNAGLKEAQAGINIAGRNINNPRYADDTTLMAESEEELKSRLMKVKEENEKVSLKLNIQKMKIMASGPTTSWEIDGETVGIVSDFIFWGSKITADGDCSHEIKRCLLLGRKVMTNLDSLLKSRDFTLPTKSA